MDIGINLQTRDVQFISGDLTLVTGVIACQQRLQIKLLFFFNEWFLDNTIGLDWFGTVYIKNASQNLIDNMILLAMTEDAEVVSILEYKTSYNILNRKLTIMMKIQTIYGPIDIKEIQTI